MQFFSIRSDLGVRALVPVWRSLLQKNGLKEDFVAGLTVACVAVPLSLAIALASGVPPAVGLVTSIISGIVCAMMGGTTLSVAGPTTTMAVLFASVVERSGADGLLVVVILAGLFQLLTGALGLGRVVKLVPAPVIEGFTAGIGAIILISQLSRVLGLPPPSASHVFDVVAHIGALLPQANPAAMAVAGVTILLVLGAPKISSKLPGPLVGVAVPTVAVAVLGIEVDRIGTIPSSLPLPALPGLPTSGWSSLLAAALMVYALASLESLLSSTALDKLSSGERHDSDQELIGQGLGNIIAALFGGLACTGVIARSALNAQAGATTRRAAMFHSLLLLVAVYFGSSILASIPIAALAGVLFSVALRMIDPAKFKALWRISRGDAAVYATTFLTIVLVDLLEGIQWGMVAALVIAAVRLGRSNASHADSGGDAPIRVALQGPVTFLASLRMANFAEQLLGTKPGAKVIVDLSEVNSIDSSGAEMLADLVERLKAQDVKVSMFGLRSELLELIRRTPHAPRLQPVIVPALQQSLAMLEILPSKGEQRLTSGVLDYRQRALPRYGSLFKQLSNGQSPHTLFFTCADSRVQTSLITSTDPGELFVVREVGNMVTRYVPGHRSSTGAAIEYAVGVLGVSEIVVCGHSGCGAIKTLREPERIPQALGVLQAWAARNEPAELAARLPSYVSNDDVSRLNALGQLDNLRSYPVVRDALASGKLRLHVWFFDVASGEVEGWDANAQSWKPVTPSTSSHAKEAGDKDALSGGVLVGPALARTGM